MQARARKYAPEYPAVDTQEPAVVKVSPVAVDHDHFAVDESGNRFAGRHLIIDVTQASPDALRDADKIRAMLTEAAEEAGATVLGIDLHCFDPGGGISGVAILAESHISIHTWPERSFAAIDVFMCGQTQPGKCIGVLRRFLSTQSLQVTELKRGYLVGAAEAI